jgi:hypothetical protein
MRTSEVALPSVSLMVCHTPKGVICAMAVADIKLSAIAVSERII